MRRGTQALRDALAGSFTYAWCADVYYGGARVLHDAAVEALSLKEDGTAKVQQSGTLTLVWQDPVGASVAPRAAGDPLSPFGTEIRLYVKIGVGRLFSERVPMGVFLVSDTPQVETSRWRFGGRIVHAGDRVRVSIKDPFYRLQRDRFDVPGMRPVKGTVNAELKRLSGLPVSPSPYVRDGNLSRNRTYGEDRLEAIYEVADSVWAHPYMTQDGALSLRSQGWTPTADTIEAADAGEQVREIAPAGFTSWAVARRNLARNPRAASFAHFGTGSNVTRSLVADFPGDIPTALRATRRATAAARLFDIRVGKSLPNDGRLVTFRALVRCSEPTSINVHARANIAASTAGPTTSVSLGAVALPAGVSEVRVTGAGLNGAALTDTDSGIAVTASGSIGATVDITAILVEDASTAADYFDGSRQARSAIRAYAWEGEPDASASTESVRERVPAVTLSAPPSRGTLLRVSRGMSAEGVYNRVVVRSQGGDAPAVLAREEIEDGPLAAGGPFGRVPYFVSSQFIRTEREATEIARARLSRVGRPQSVVIDVEEAFNPLREVGDVVTIKRLGETYRGRVSGVSRSLEPRQTTTLVVAGE